VLDPSGEPLTALLLFLQRRRGIDLARSRHDETAREIGEARGSTYLILSEEHLPRAAELDERLYTPAELTAFFNDLRRRNEGEGVGERMREALGFLRRALEAVGPGTIVLLAML
jgi:hypothetical protein